MILGAGWVYLMPQKTGTASVRNWLTRNYGGKLLWPYHGREIPKSHERALKFMTVRNPYDRFRSLWRFEATKGRIWTFDELVHEMAENKSLVGWRDETGATIFLHLERLRAEVTALPFFDRRKPLPPHMRKTVGFERFVLDEAKRAVIRDLFARDFEEFGYEP